jgi:SAM-dependent methyltransferase
MTDRSVWDEHAATFDDEPDHGLRDPVVRAAWTDLLLPLMPPVPADVLDLGCGTGSLSLLLATSGHRVRALDLSSEMLAAAQQKASSAALDVEFQQGDAAAPPYPGSSCDVVLTRHVLWALPDPDAALARWVTLLRPSGRLVLVEGYWSTGAGLTATDCASLVRAHRLEAAVTPLTDPALWGRAVTDERYLVLSRT